MFVKYYYHCHKSKKLAGFLPLMIRKQHFWKERKFLFLQWLFYLLNNSALPRSTLETEWTWKTSSFLVQKPARGIGRKPLCPSHFCSLSLSLALSLSLYLALWLSLTLTLSLSFSHSLSCSHSLWLFPTFSLSQFLFDRPIAFIWSLSHFLAPLSFTLIVCFLILSS